MVNRKQGLINNARSPGSIVNAQHHDPSGSEKSSNGVPGTIESVVATSTTAFNLKPYAMLWVVNRNAAVQYILTTREDLIPVTVDATNGMAIPAGEGMLINCGASDNDMKSMQGKTSSADVHVTILET